jgi:hypothetical protein
MTGRNRFGDIWMAPIADSARPPAAPPTRIDAHRSYLSGQGIGPLNACLHEGGLYLGGCGATRRRYLTAAWGPELTEGES